MPAVLDGLKFFAQSLTNAGAVGAVWPSSKGLCEAMVRPVVADAGRPLRVLEVGAGVGPVTTELLARLLPGDTLDVVELNETFCATLHERFDGASPVAPTIHNADILKFEPGYRYNHIVSGLPLANFPSELAESIYHRYFDLLEPEGTLIMFHHLVFRHAIRFLGAPKHRTRAARLLEFERELEPLVVGESTVMFNLPPAKVTVRRRPSVGDKLVAV
jgi:phospholipid N-methyltransferase